MCTTSVQKFGVRKDFDILLNKSEDVRPHSSVSSAANQQRLLGEPHFAS